MKLFLFTFITGVTQEHLWGTAFAITTNICLTKDLNKNIIGALIAASIWEIISKNVL